MHSLAIHHTDMRLCFYVCNKQISQKMCYCCKLINQHLRAGSILTFELAALQQRPGLLQGEELLNGDEVVVYP